MDILTRIAGLVSDMQQRGAIPGMLVLGRSEQAELKAAAEKWLDAPLNDIVGMEYEGRTILGCKEESYLGAVVEEPARQKELAESPVNNHQQTNERHSG